MDVVDLFPKTLNPVPHPKIAGAYVKGDPFLVKLQEIDRDLQKYDQVSSEKVDSLRNQPNTQISHTEGDQNEKEALVGYTSDNKMSMITGKNKILEGPGEQGKIGIEPGLQKEKKKGQWIRLLNRLSSDLMEEGPHGAKGQKRKARDFQAREENNTKKGEKQKTEEVVTKQCELLIFGIGGCYGATPPGAISLLCWNCHGLGNRQTVQELGDLVWAQDPTVVFLAETWLDDIRLSGIRDSPLFGHYHGVSRLTRGGGLVLFWKKDFDLQVMSSSHNHIDVLINGGKENVWRFTSFYGAPKTQHHMESWNLLQDLNNRFSVPWLCGGDFNELLKSHEKLGGRLRPYGQMQKFREALDECGLFDLGFVGNKFTWFKTHPGGGVI